MNADEKLELIKRNTQEIVNEDELKNLFETMDSPHAYIGFACTGDLHAGHMIPIRKIVDFLNAGCKFTFLIADLHAYLDDSKTPWDKLDERFDHYKRGATGMLKAFNAPLDKVNFVKGTDYELDSEYMKSVLLMAGEVTLNRSKRAASEVVRFKEDPRLGGFLYPLLQIEDVYALDCQIAFGGIDQRGIYMLGRDMAQKMNRDKYVCVFTPLLPGLTGDKMSASDPNSKIGILDSADEVQKKMNKAHCPEKEVEGNGILAFLNHVVFPHLAGKVFLIERPEKFGGNMEFSSYQDLENAYVAGDLHPLDVKNALAKELNSYLEIVQKEF